MATAIDGLNIASVTVSSTTVPVSVIPATFRNAGWVVRNRGTGETGTGGPVYLFPYIGAVPAAVPSPLDVWSLAPGSSLNDNISGSFQGVDAGVSTGWAAVLQSGATTIVDAQYR